MERFKDHIKKIDKKAALIVSALTVLTMTPLLFQGIICNDELQTRFIRKLGMLELLKDNIRTAIAKGRTIGGFVDVREISFLSNNMYINRFADIVMILIAIALFCYLIYKLDGNKYFSYFLGVVIMACLPVTFEHGAPNAFVAITVIPMMLVLVSLILFWNYLNSGKRRYLAGSMALYMISMLQYEFIVTYVVLMYLLIIKCQLNNGGIRWKQAAGQAVVPTVSASCYVIAYFAMQHLHASNYSGNTMGFVSVKSSLKILYVLAKSSMPGYFLLNEKYRHYEKLIADSFEYGAFLKIIACLIVLLSAGVIFMISEKCRKKKDGRNIVEILVAAFFMIIPALPNAISSLYQGAVTETFFTWLPVSIFLYFAACFFVCSVLWNIFRILNRYALAAGALCVACLIGRIQFMNYINADQQRRDFDRLQAIEKMFDMQMWKDLGAAEIYTEDLYETRNLLAVHDTFWSRYLENNGCVISVNSGSSETLPNLYFLYDEYFVLTNGEIAIVCSQDMMKGSHTIRLSKDRYACAKFKKGTEDGGNYIYCFEMNGTKSKSISLERALEELL